MSTRGTFFAGLFTAGVVGSVPAPAAPDTAPMPTAHKDAGETIAIAPPPRAPGQPAPALVVGPARKSTKPWAELIVGKWMRIEPPVVGQVVWEFTRDGKVKSQYSYPEAPGRPRGIERGSWSYRVNGTNLFPTETLNDGDWVRDYTTFIDTLTDNELVTSWLKRKRPSLEFAKQLAAERKVPLQQILGEVDEERGRSAWIRLKDRDK
jgi:hypothetical protein